MLLINLSHKKLVELTYSLLLLIQLWQLINLNHIYYCEPCHILLDCLTKHWRSCVKKLGQAIMKNIVKNKGKQFTPKDALSKVPNSLVLLLMIIDPLKQILSNLFFIYLLLLVTQNSFSNNFLKNPIAPLSLPHKFYQVIYLSTLILPVVII